MLLEDAVFWAGSPEAYGECVPITVDKGAPLVLADGNICVEGHRGDSSVFINIMPGISDVSIIKDDSGAEKVVCVEFLDGTLHKAVLQGGDTFSLEQGISICVTKKLLDMRLGGRGSSLYNRIVNQGMKVYKEIQKKNKMIDEEIAKQEARQKKIEDKKRKKREKRLAAERETQIEIYKEAYLRAMREYNSTFCGALTSIQQDVSEG